MIRTDSSNAFAHNTMKVRVPKIIRDVQQSNPDYPTSIQEALTQLASDIENNALMPPLAPLPAPDYDVWMPAYEEHQGHRWLNTDWFFAETYFYRLLIQAVRWWETGRDPFTSHKQEELASEQLWTLLERASSLCDSQADEQLAVLIQFALWGNRIDLSYAASLAHGNSGSDEDLLVDDSRAAVEHLLNQVGAVHFIADNTGTELATDLALVDALLENGTSQVVLHVKMYPQFVSDALPADVRMLIEVMQAHGGQTGKLGERLHIALDKERLRLAPDFFWNSSYLLWDMPLHLYQVFQGASLVIAKGDLNYRRMVGDALWSADTPFDEVTSYFPAPLLALRTMKSDPVVGLPAGKAEQLDRTDAAWRVSGRLGLMQFRK
jgi:uncharacterized protein with ATP-grasp and redox domains